MSTQKKEKKAKKAISNRTLNRLLIAAVVLMLAPFVWDGSLLLLPEDEL